MDALKVAAARAINRSHRIRGHLWQRRYYDRAIRTVKEYHDTLRYLHLNPVSKGLVKKLEDWAWSSIHAYGGPGPLRLEIRRLELPTDEQTFL